MNYKSISVSEAKEIPVQFACISMFDLQRLGIKEEDIQFFIIEDEEGGLK